MARNIVGFTRNFSQPKGLPRIHKAYISEGPAAGVFAQTRQLRKHQESEKRRAYLKSLPLDASQSDNVQSCFLPDDYYQFQEGHYDGVIHGYREMHLASWPMDEFEGLSSVIKRLHALCPSQNIQTHLLHLATRGYIMPHIDNTDASGNWILGVSLGDERLLRLDPLGDAPSFQFSLPSGSVYIQSGDVRHTYKHSIIQKVEGGQRLSVLIRDSPTVL